MAWRCFLVEESGDVVLSLRRFAWRDKRGECSQRPGMGHHVSVVVGRAPARYTVGDEDRRFYTSIDIDPWLIDYRWPARCVCGYEFSDGDMMMIDQDPIFRGADDQEYTQTSLPIGGIYEISWGRPHWVGWDGKCFQIKLPPGRTYDVWMIDGPASNGGFWKREGSPPDISVTPSIATGQYHGFLGSNTAPAPGWLSDPL